MTHARLVGIAAGLLWCTIALGSIWAPSAQADDPVITCKQYYSSYDCHWTDSRGERHKTTEYCYNDGSCTIRKVY